MEKLANTEYSILHLLEQRWSPRSFSNRIVEPRTLRTLFEAARWAPSSYNEQPWRFIIASKDDEDDFNRLLSCLTEGNIKWAKNAPVLMLSVAKLQFERNGKNNRHAFHDVGMAMENFIIQATALNLYVHQMAGFDIEKARALFKIPEGYEPVAAIALGYLDDKTKAVEKEKSAERERKPFSEFVFAERFGKPSDLFSD